MQAKNRALLEGAVHVARGTGADAVILAAAMPEEKRFLRDALGSSVRVLTAAGSTARRDALEDGEVLVLPEVKLRRRGRAKIALLEGLAAGLLLPGQRVVVISGNGSNGECELDTVAVIELNDDEDYLGAQEDAPLSILREVADPATFDAVLGLCVELGHEGKEGKRVGLLVTLGDTDQVMERSHQIVLNPFEGHPENERCLLTPAARRALREFSGMDGGFVVRSDGVIVAAGRYLQELAPENVVPSGLGARHRAAAGITASTRALAFVVSETTGDTRVFGGGRLLMTLERND
ncbi:MAG: DNA integrity scanning protein DisA nucleotide-binding domain protein [Longimicrobiales bacterium]